MNGDVDVTIATLFGGTYNGSPTPGSGYGNCANTYCHSDGTSLATGIIPANVAPVWGGSALTCTACHGCPPSYENGHPKANSHLRHAAYGCGTCHALTTVDGTTINSSDTSHCNTHFDLWPVSGGYAGITFTYTFNANGGTCTNISCHDSNNKTAVWGSTLQ